MDCTGVIYMLAGLVVGWVVGRFLGLLLLLKWEDEIHEFFDNTVGRLLDRLGM